MFASFRKTLLSEAFSSKCLIKKMLLKKFSKLTEQNICQSLFSNKIAGSRFKCQTYKMLKHTQTICWQMLMNILSVFDNFVGLAVKGLKGDSSAVFFCEFCEVFKNNYF